MRGYDVAVTSLAIDAPHKWTDNLLSHYDIPHVSGDRRGVARRLSREGLLIVALVRELHTAIGMSVRNAVPVAVDMLCSGAHRSGHLQVRVDRVALERAVDHRLLDALESAPTRRRGRPPRKADQPVPGETR